ncbi:MAG TPA: fimbrial protein FimV, partial [Casimicrobiaceae bacterium]|nr:fimbrial protein FimV [Casimicrobiaceae bacterium]
MAGALAVSPSALALGLGKLTVDSALGQPLSARIELTSVSRDELESLSAKIADPTLYRQNNLTYQGVLARTRVVVEFVGGSPVLKISSPTAVTEP